MLDYRELHFFITLFEFRSNEKEQIPAFLKFANSATCEDKRTHSSGKDIRFQSLHFMRMTSNFPEWAQQDILVLTLEKPTSLIDRSHNIKIIHQQQALPYRFHTGLHFICDI